MSWHASYPVGLKTLSIFGTEKGVDILSHFIFINLLFLEKEEYWKIFVLRIINLVFKIILFFNIKHILKIQTNNLLFSVIKKLSHPKSLNCLGKVLGYDLYYSLTHPLK
jgi:hypothetical protein